VRYSAAIYVALQLSVIPYVSVPTLAVGGVVSVVSVGLHRIGYVIAIQIARSGGGVPYKFGPTIALPV